ncbi:glutamine-hydrolyzing carbamoyl-phosphate synthase small subunit [Taylorella equigenitalis]|uniref:glutamine-hydrolyzing carbamoyl-phosphate synthase small subunit n=1 Tax=Taylorella equigenitalis TaxID=29575 RepID=UPI0023B10D99|nr:glutamine-hydrolyzing carbamoyl-phosphate synthase small subunit [Taylorella equigenitalis]WEE00076.1 glutamine-hydrolyzing carbamoyl-phosphate synthase small subunit [Taylorella equigenitalis]WEE01553.1 glutamine-hydrolyzing carbamoyl-phosphate synthase small subunit [Taylorella equigenitalis]WFD79568.1 glutamine-hydrolyzing carbamoyl-phosphate synthase small subunit [Taylorella equigenitalis]WFD81044.1 glutamine-hydrolyzing carbamoyl-phosphate synthase small subunit [Taylorella equigenital
MLHALLSKGTKEYPSAILALADGTVFKGISIGVDGHTVGEIVFNTSMTGYQEILTDPSYSQQIITLTYPHIGNTGINSEDIESNIIRASGLVVRNCPKVVSSFRSQKSLPEYLKENGIVSISEIDTRKLTRILRDKGAQGACILVGDDEQKAIELAKNYPGMVGQDLASDASVKEKINWTEGAWSLKRGYSSDCETRFHVVAYDFGIKYNILRLLHERGCKITLVPSTTTAQEVLGLNPDGVFLANGPGDPSAVGYAIDTAKVILDKKIPLFGICLGHQIMGLALGAKTIKMKAGHHGANHPVKEVETGSVYITSQNHGFAVDAETLPSNARVTHVSLFDGSLQGFELTDRPAFCFQGHPEASPGPHDAMPLFDKFIRLMEAK